MELDFGNCGIRENQLNELTDALASKHGRKKVKKINLSGNQLTDRSVPDLFQRVPSAFQSLIELNLENNKIGAESIKSIAAALAESSPSKLASLTLSHNPLGVSGLLKLEEIICSNSLSNLGWLYLRGSLTSDADINSAILTTLIGALVAHCPKLCELDLSQNNLSVPGTCAIGITILGKNYCRLETLKLSKCQLTSSKCDHQSSGKFLNEEKLREVEQKLCQMPPNSTITRLYLQENNFNGERIHILSSLMVLCSHLKYLNSTHCQINSDDLKKLLNRLNERKSSFPNLCLQLRSWNLDNNQLDDSGVSALLNDLPSLFPQVWKGRVVRVRSLSGSRIIFGPGVTIKNNSISREMTMRVKAEMQKRIKVYSYVYYYIIGPVSRCQ